MREQIRAGIVSIVAAVAGLAQAQYPDKPIRIMVPMALP